MTIPLPAYTFPDTMPSLWAMAQRGVNDVASCIPASILDEPAVQLPGPGAPLVVADPALAKLVLNDRTGAFDRDRLIRRAFRRSWGKGLAAVEGADWKAQRHAAAPAFRPQAVVSDIPHFVAAGDWASTQLVEDGEIELSRLASRTIARVTFSALIGLCDDVDMDAAAADVQRYIDSIAGFSLIDLLPLPERWIDRLTGVDKQAEVVRLRGLARTIARRMERGETPATMIGLIEGAGPVEDNIRGLFPAAMDTTTSGLGWALRTLASFPEWQERIADEAKRTAGWTPDEMPGTRRVVQEILRLYPPAPLLVRSAAETQYLGDFRVSRGQPVVVATYAMQRHRRHWHDPDTFDPDRFAAGAAPSPAYMPFGTGPRMCIAAQFALTELSVIMARLLRDWRLEPAGPEPQVTLRVTTRSANGLHVVARRRA